MIFLEGTYEISSNIHEKKFKALDKLIKAATKIILFHHSGMDMDAKASTVAMAVGIKSKYGKEVKIAKKGDFFDLEKTDLVILLDVGDLFRLEGSFKGNPVIARIDHHPTSFKCQLNIEDISAGSTAELVTIFLNNFDYLISPTTAEMLFKGIIADTGRLQYKISDSSLIALSILKSLNIDYKNAYNQMYIKDEDDVKLRKYMLNNYKVSKNGLIYLYLDRERSLDAEIDMSRAGKHLHELGDFKNSPIWVLITDIGSNRITMRIRSRSLPINKIAEKYGGGGLENAAAIRVKSKQEAKHILAELDRYLVENRILNKITEAELNTALEDILNESRLPKDGSDPEFGIPEEEKYPLFDKAHVISAIKLFGHVEDKYEAQLAHAIIAKMKKYNISFDMVGENNRLYKYLPKSELNESKIESKKHYDGKTLEVDVEAKLNDKNQKVKIDDTEIEVKKKKGKLELDVEVETDIHVENNKNINYYNNKLPKDIETARKAGIPNNLAEVIAEAVIELSEKQIGAFITFEKEDNLEKYRKNGEKINAPVSRDIFMTIFYPGTAVHDGAIIIKDGIIKYANVFYENISSDKFAEHYGARHRAAMGISKDTDAVVIVISEETGRISFAVDGELIVTKPNDVEKNIEKYILTQSLEESTKYKYKKLLNMPEDKRNQLISKDESYANAWNKWKDTDKSADLAHGEVVAATIHNTAAKFAKKDLEDAKTKYEKIKAEERKNEHYDAKNYHISKAFKYANQSDRYSIDTAPDEDKPGINSITFTNQSINDLTKSQITLHTPTDNVKNSNSGKEVKRGQVFIKRNNSSGRSVNDETVKKLTKKTLKVKAGKEKPKTINNIIRKKNNNKQ